MKKPPKNPVGRPPKLTDARYRNVYLDDASWEKAVKIGDGSGSEGIRIALAADDGLRKAAEYLNYIGRYSKTHPEKQLLAALRAELDKV